ncbi:MAG TPA: hypothetical protein VGD98_02250 [Ktedonobacteraceae bacterium]
MATTSSPFYPKRFFDLQLRFAQKIAELSQQPLAEAVLYYTALYRILGLDWSLDPANPAWQEYLQQLQQEQADAERTYQFYLLRDQYMPKFTAQTHWGCFAYDYNVETRAIHLHFANQDTSGYGALSSHQRATRISELRAMFQHIQESRPEAALVRGTSWLYHREAYRRLFPALYGQSVQVASNPNLSARALWGQFLQHDWQVNEEMLSTFFQRIEQLNDAESCMHCFPYTVLQTESLIYPFYAFYGI